VRSVSRRLADLIRSEGTSAALSKPVRPSARGGKPEDPLAALFTSNDEDPVGERIGAIAGTTVLFGDLLADLARIDPRVVAAADFSRAEDIDNVFSFASFADQLSSLDGAAAVGAQSNLRGYVAEQYVLWRLVRQGHRVEMPDDPNQPGWDLRVDGVEVQVKCLGSTDGLDAHFQRWPEIPAIANSDLADEIQTLEPAWADQVFFVDGFTHEQVEEITLESLDSGADLLEADVPMATIVASSARGIHAWWRGDLGLADILIDVGVDASGKALLGGIGAVAGKGIGLLAFGPAGAVIGAPMLAALAAGKSGAFRRLVKRHRRLGEQKAVLATSTGLLQTTREAVAENRSHLAAAVGLLDESGSLQAVLAERLRDDAIGLEHASNRIAALSRRNDDDAWDCARATVEAVRRARVHPARLQSEWRSFLDATSALLRGIGRWL
jgi:hypothetical protein